VKRYFWWVIAIVVLLVVVFSIFGYLKARETNNQGNKLKQMTAGTLDIKPLSQGDVGVDISGWEILSDKAETISNSLGEITLAPESLKEQASRYYSVEAQNRYAEAKYLKILIEFQVDLDLKSSQPKSKNQIEAILDNNERLQNDMNQNSPFLGPEFDTLRDKMQGEADTFISGLTDINNKMTSESAPVQLSSAGLDKAIDELNQEIILSLNKWVDMQNEIKDGINVMIGLSWASPF
jgi:hypothetical protein